MLPRWLAVLGFAGLCTSFACFPPLAVAPIATVKAPTGASPRPASERVSPAWSASPGPGETPAPASNGSPLPVTMPSTSDAAYFPIIEGTYRYGVTSTPASGPPIAGARTTLVGAVTRDAAGVARAEARTTVTLNVPGFTALDQADVAATATLAADRFELREQAGRTYGFPIPLGPAAWTENDLTATAAAPEAVTLATLPGRPFQDVRRVEYRTAGAAPALVATAWFARGVGLIRRTDVFLHQGQRWEADAQLTDWPGK